MDDPIPKSAWERIEEDKAIEEEVKSTHSTVHTLIERRKQLKRQIRDLEHEIGAGDKTRVWIRTLPDPVWLPIHITYSVIAEMMPVRKTAGRPQLSSWGVDADMGTFAVNVALGIMLLSAFFTVFGFVF